MEVSIAPGLDEIRREGNVFECDFNKMHIEWIIAMDCRDMSDENELKLKKWLQNAIALSGKLWQVPYALNNGGLPFSSGGVGPQGHNGRCNGFAVRPVQNIVSK